MDVALAKFFLDALKEIRSVLTSTPSKSDSLLGAGSVMALYGSATRLAGLADRCRETFDQGRRTLAPEELECMEDFVSEVHHFGLALRTLNLYAVEIHNAPLARDIGRIVGEDADLLGSFRHSVAPNHYIQKQIKAVVALYVENFQVSIPDVGWKLEGEGILVPWRRWFRWGRDSDEEQVDKAAIINVMSEMATSFQSCRALLADMIKENWSLKELLGVKDTSSPPN